MSCIDITDILDPQPTLRIHWSMEKQHWKTNTLLFSLLTLIRLSQAKEFDIMNVA